MALPHIKIALVFANAVRNHGHKLLHITDTDLLIKDLGLALKEQKDTLKDPNSGTLETMYDLLSTIAEVKILMAVVSKKLGLDTAGKSSGQILQEIIDVTEKDDSDAAQDIKETLDWSLQFFSRPDVQELLGEEKIEIEAPKSITDVGKTIKQTGGKVSQEIRKVHNFLKMAKKNKPK